MAEKAIFKLGGKFMELIFFTEVRIVRVGEDFYSSESSFDYSLLKRYLNHFESIVIFARTRSGVREEVLPKNKLPNDKIKVYELPYYKGFNSFLKKYFALKKSIDLGLEKHLTDNTAVLCRVPGRIGATGIQRLKSLNAQYAIEVVGDPYDTLSNGGTTHPLAPIIRFFSVRSLKKIARESPMALYVTEVELQRRYPNDHFNIGVSDVVMTDDAFVEKREPKTNSTPFIVICVGSLDQMMKAPDVVVKAISLLIKEGYSVQLEWVGDGIYKQEMIDLCEQLNISNCVTFHGKLPAGKPVRDKLDAADLFVMPSRMEGLPRAMVEAMARQLPCIGTRLCGIQELLEKDCLVEVNDIHGLAQKIKQFIDSRDMIEKHSKINYEKSLRYHENFLTPKRDRFYKRLAKKSAI
ncbi:glycosyltransferase family 4 protein [Flavilitoribacter nigricans]|uniref:Glycosyl transferase family 1 domain-containing protein n=1 Tax=Flavilitoribacter nigricans (strain ATCC 23147 / DSM 23189 / NBRC 102662 / NCIMB 1420 / SS-2) TaxID=1122177 RepID=A0A2D0MZ12_FLAN2|nr:glycosyltransferase [Flavilitoribacter nigricans]PHN01485.1 hypothetical protein CRP01_36910 [Flavilitoribacter nigricans DSM 23189 = NBRC 102662]